MVKLNCGNLLTPHSVYSEFFFNLNPSLHAVKHTYDDHPPADSEVKVQYAAYKLLEATIRCEAHKGHCYIESTGGQDNH